MWYLVNTIYLRWNLPVNKIIKWFLINGLWLLIEGAHQCLVNFQTFRNWQSHWIEAMEIDSESLNIKPLEWWLIYMEMAKFYSFWAIAINRRSSSTRSKDSFSILNSKLCWLIKWMLKFAEHQFARCVVTYGSSYEVWSDADLNSHWFQQLINLIRYLFTQIEKASSTKWQYLLYR